MQTIKPAFSYHELTNFGFAKKRALESWKKIINRRYENIGNIEIQIPDEKLIEDLTVLNIKFLIWGTIIEESIPLEFKK